MKKLFLFPILILCLLFGAHAQEDAEIIEIRKGFWVQSAMNYQKDNGGYWDIPGRPDKIEQGSNIQVYDIDEGKDRLFYLKTTEEMGVYQIVPGDKNNSIMLTVAEGEENKKKNGANIETYRMIGRDWQKFRFKHLGNGEFKIYTLDDMVVCLDGRKNANGTNVHIWEDHDGDWMTWYLIDPDTKEAWIPENQPQEPVFFTENNLTYRQTNHSLKFEGSVTNVDFNDNLVKITVEGRETGRNPGTGQMIDKETTKVKEIYFQNGIYYMTTYDMAGGKFIEQTKPHTDDNNVQYMHVGRGRFTVE
jgi:hypothetical protein